ncbi:MAG: glycine betaine/L-proline ABC transporter ATP-binding protein [Nitriliruptorales bacterium]|nr:glycine betaine/L-proline ABC transporter ATP-binding protein [Nitriliruptorales bacterium]
MSDTTPHDGQPEGAGAAKIRTRGLTKVFGSSTETDRALKLADEGATQEEILEQTGATIAVRDADLDIPAHRIFAVMGLSGSGKSTLLRCLNRLIEPTRGTVEVDGEDVTAMDEGALRELRRRKLGMVFQHFALWPHRSVRDNVAYGLEIQGVDEDERHERAQEVIDTVGLDGWEDSLPGSLSGGMQQRVGLARALAIDPDILLMDEPFSALDPLVRRDMQEELLDLQDRVKKTIVFITHDLDEAIKLGSQMAIMKAGRIIQTGTPEEILRNPEDEYVASFVEDVDPSRVLRAEDVMEQPSEVVRPGHSPRVALRMMDKRGLSSAFVVEEGGRLRGIVTADGAADAADRGVEDVAEMDTIDAATAAPDTPLRDLIDMAADEPYPIAIVDDEGNFRGLTAWVSIVRGLAESHEKADRSSVESDRETAEAV